MAIWQFPSIRFGNFLVYDFWTPPPPINFVLDHFLYFYMAAALGPLACASRSARPPSLSIAAALGPESVLT